MFDVIVECVSESSDSKNNLIILISECDYKQKIFVLIAEIILKQNVVKQNIQTSSNQNHKKY